MRDIIVMHDIISGRDDVGGCGVILQSVRMGIQHWDGAVSRPRVEAECTLDFRPPSWSVPGEVGAVAGGFGPGYSRLDTPCTGVVVPGADLAVYDGLLLACGCSRTEGRHGCGHCKSDPACNAHALCYGAEGRGALGEGGGGGGC